MVKSANYNGRNYITFPILPLLELPSKKDETWNTLQRRKMHTHFIHKTSRAGDIHINGSIILNLMISRM
jgi:hypothetical protein